MSEIVTAQRTAEWYEARLGKVTASLSAACLGLDPYKSARKAWREITGTEPYREPSRAQSWGTTYEATARLDLEAHTGAMIETCGFFQHELLPWLGGSPDGLIGADGLAEIKCPAKAATKVPVHHRIQCLVNLAVTGRSYCLYWSWGADGSRLLVRIERAGIPGLLVRLERFWRDFVLSGQEPPRKQRKRSRA